MRAANTIKLPKSLETLEQAHKIVSFISRLGPNSGFYSAIVYENQKGRFFLQKDNDFPFIPLDWTIYTLMRSLARTIISSGLTLRKQPHVYSETMGSYGKSELLQTYQNNLNQPFNFIVLTRSMSDEQIRKSICEKYFNFVSLKEIIPEKSEITFKELAYKVNSLGIGPTLYENGETTLNQALRNLQPNEVNFSDMVILSLYQGEIPQKYISAPYDMQVLHRDFEKVYASSSIKTEVTGTSNQSSIKFEIYLRKDLATKEGL